MKYENITKELILESMYINIKTSIQQHSITSIQAYNVFWSDEQLIAASVNGGLISRGVYSNYPLAYQRVVELITELKNEGYIVSNLKGMNSHYIYTYTNHSRVELYRFTSKGRKFAEGRFR